VGIGIQKTNGGIGIHHLNPVPDEKLPDCNVLIRYRTGIVILFWSGTGLPGCRTVRYSGILNYRAAS
jgi:hypothetical protein